MLMSMPMPMNNLLCRGSELHLFSFTASARQSYRSFQTSRVFLVRVASVVRHPPCNLSDVGIPKYHAEYELTTTGCRHDATWQDDKVNRISPTKYRYDDLLPSTQWTWLFLNPGDDRYSSRTYHTEYPSTGYYKRSIRFTSRSCALPSVSLLWSPRLCLSSLERNLDYYNYACAMVMGGVNTSNYF